MKEVCHKKANTNCKAFVRRRLIQDQFIQLQSVVEKSMKMMPFCLILLTNKVVGLQSK